jgi:biopolymer transport protein ExbD
MAGGEVTESRTHEKKGKKRKKGRRLGIRNDLTPLVDVAFLLLTFFMFTTTMSRPQTMEINLPPDPNAKVEIAESNLLTLRVNAKGDVFWNYGIESPKKIEGSALRAFLTEKRSTNPKMTALLKIDREGKYEMMVNMIDDFGFARIDRFSIAPLMDNDKALMAKVQS